MYVLIQWNSLQYYKYIRNRFRRTTDKTNKSKTIIYVHTQYINAKETYYRYDNYYEDDINVNDCNDSLRERIEG
jgi:hypothetical protein